MRNIPEKCETNTQESLIYLTLENSAKSASFYIDLFIFQYAFCVACVSEGSRSRAYLANTSELAGLVYNVFHFFIGKDR